MSTPSPSRPHRRSSDESYSAAEAARRRDAIVRNMIATPPATQDKTKASRAKAASRKRRKPA